MTPWYNTPGGKDGKENSDGQKELLRGKILEMVKQGKMTLKAAAVTMQVSYRQAKRLNAAYRKEGDTGLVHGNCGKRSNNRIAEAVRENVLQAYKERYNDWTLPRKVHKIKQR